MFRNSESSSSMKYSSKNRKSAHVHGFLLLGFSLCLNLASAFVPSSISCGSTLQHKHNLCLTGSQDSGDIRTPFYPCRIAGTINADCSQRICGTREVLLRQSFRSNEDEMIQGEDYGTLQEGNYGARQGTSYGARQGTDFGTRQGTEYTLGQGTNYGMGQETNYGMIQETDYGMNESENFKVNPAEGLEVLMYRLFLCGSALSISVYFGAALLNVVYDGTTLLDSYGINCETFDTTRRCAGLAFAQFGVLGALATPKDIRIHLDVQGNFKEFQLSQAFGMILPILGFASQLALAVILFLSDSFMESEESHALFSVAALPLVAVCAREIYFYGLAYKVEAFLSMTLLFWLVFSDFPLQNPLPLTGLLALALSVLATGKIFEPLVEDLRPGNSKFFMQ